MGKIFKITEKQKNELISEGVSFENGRFVFDYNNNKSTDLINFRNLICYKTMIRDKAVYFYGFEFRKDVDSDLRTKFIEGIKSITFDIPEQERRDFLAHGVNLFLSTVKVNSFDCMVYPTSERSIINHELVDLINVDITVKNKSKFELVKNLPLNITFDYEAFENQVLELPTKNGRPRYTDAQKIDVLSKIGDMMKKINGLSYFSIARDVKTKYRRYIRNFLKFKDEKSRKLFESLENGTNVLIVDNINTSFSTLNEIVRIMTEVNNNVNIYVFTLIGKQYQN